MWFVGCFCFVVLVLACFVFTDKLYLFFRNGRSNLKSTVFARHSVKTATDLFTFLLGCPLLTAIISLLNVTHTLCPSPPPPQFKELEGLVKELISEKTSSHQVLPAIQPRSAGPAHNPSPCPPPPQQKLKRGEHIDKRKYNPFPWLISRSLVAREGFTRGWNSTRLLPGQRHGKQK